MILSLFIDDGVKDRGHRVNMQNPLLVYMGCYSGFHKVYGGMTAINYAGPLQLTPNTPDPMERLIQSLKEIKPTFKNNHEAEKEINPF